MRTLARACGIVAVTSGAVLVGTLPAVAAPGTAQSGVARGVNTALPAQDGISGTTEDDAHDEDGHEHDPQELVSPELAEFDEELAEAAEEIEELREEAARATARHERLRRKSAQEQADLVVLAEELKNEQTRLDTLRAMVGQQAGSRYRAGGGAALAHLMFSESPEAFFISSSLIGRGEMTAVTLLERTQQSEERLKEAEKEMRDLRADTAETTAEQQKIREGVEEKLELAEERLTELEEAKAAAVERIRAERAAERRAESGAAVDEDEVLRDATDPGACAVSVRDDERLAEDAVEEEWTSPVHEAYTLTASYGQNGNRWSSTHSGQDFAIPSGTPVLTIGAGRIAATSCNDAYGHAVVVEHENGYYSQYAHLSVIEVEAGQEIGAGQRLGRSGNTGNSSGPHLHFEIRLTPWIGSAVNPVPWLRDHGVEL
ncbi:peptidoglycan DD-metalloendopeptidase family protein [Streptomyces spiramenti]|uniref:Peptidoglycan DD-metalloendopeptidase family protein n=1 Tax=Streptomyces spiramenti TaxID=2720606 RepID=A0ABX1ATY9_9ACTN|nr:peptidoglycan DD-metalloendopeptidase family protein [Streptomyces spiramenti]